MNIALRIVRWLLAIGISLALSLWIFLATVNATLANRNVVKSWIAGSSVYDSALSSLFDVSADSKQALVQDSAQEAFVQTFDAAYLRQGAETTLDATYDWAEGKTNAITFSIPVQEKQADFYRNLAAILTPKLQTLPACPTRSPIDTENITCLPAGIDATTYAAQLTRPASDSAILKDPITQDSFKDVPPMPWVPTAVQSLRISLWALPLMTVVFAGLYVLASPDRIRGVNHVARRLTIGAAVTLIGGAFMWFASTSIDLASAVDASNPTEAAQQKTIINNLMNPLARIILPSIGQALTLYSGIVVAIAGATWLGVFIWRHKRGSDLPKPPHHTGGSAVPPPPTDSPEMHLPTPTAKP